MPIPSWPGRWRGPSLLIAEGRAGAPAPARIAAAVGALTAVAAVLRFWGLGRQGLWFDEANTAQLLQLSPGHMLGLLPQSESTPPLYYCVAWVWVRIFGNTAAGLRSLSAVAGVAMVPVAYALAAELVSRRAGLICAALTACNPLLVWYSQEARAYELLVLLSAVSVLAAARAVREPSRRRVALWTLAAVLALATPLLRRDRGSRGDRLAGGRPTGETGGSWPEQRW